jgi:hypothetical protein
MAARVRASAASLSVPVPRRRLIVGGDVGRMSGSSWNLGDDPGLAVRR